MKKKLGGLGPRKMISDDAGGGALVLKAFAWRWLILIWGIPAIFPLKNSPHLVAKKPSYITRCFGELYSPH